MKRTWFYRFKEVLDSSDFCSYCGTSLQDWEKVIDHFYPVSAWGRNIKWNLFVSCRECNAIKTDLVFDSHSEARQWILPRKKQKLLISESWIYKEIEPVIEPVQQQVISTMDGKYSRLLHLQKYEWYSYVLWVWYIDKEKRKLIKQYLFSHYHRLYHIWLLHILSERRQQQIIIYINNSLW